MSGVIGRNFRFMSGGVMGVALLQYALYFLVARYLGVEGYGDFAIALTMALLAAPLCDLGMNVSVVWTHTRTPERLPEVLGASLCIRLTLALPVGLGIGYLGYLLGFSPTVLWLFAPLFLAAVLDGVSGLWSAVFQSREQMGYSSAIMLARNGAKAVAFAGTLVLGGDLLSLVVSFFAAALLIALTSYWLLRHHLPLRFTTSALRPVLRTAWPFGSAIIASLLLLQSDILMLGHYSGDTAVGFYHAAFRFLVMAELLPQIISMVVMPRCYRMGHQDGAARLSRFYRTQTVVLGSLGILGSLLLALHGDRLAAWTLGDEFQGSGVLLIALSPLVFMRYMSVPLGDALASLGRQHRLSQSVWLAFYVNLGLNLWLIPRYGTIGAAIATGCSQLCMLSLQTLFVIRSGLELQWRRVLGHAWLASALVAAVYFLAPDLSLGLIPAALLLLLALHRWAPTTEQLALQQHSRLLARLGGRPG